MFDDDLTGHVLLSRCLLAQARITEAKTVLDEVRAAAARNQKSRDEPHLYDRGCACQSAQNPRTSLRAVRSQLMNAKETARRLGLTLLEYEARLALGEAETKAKAPAGSQSLNLLEEMHRPRLRT